MERRMGLRIPCFLLMLLVICILFPGAKTYADDSEAGALAGGGGETVEVSQDVSTDFSFINGKDKGTFDTITERTRTTSTSVYWVLISIGTVVFVSIIAFLGFKMLLGGSAAKSEVKQHALLITLAALAFFSAVFVASTLVSAILSLGK